MREFGMAPLYAVVNIHCRVWEKNKKRGLTFLSMCAWGGISPLSHSSLTLLFSANPLLLYHD